MKLIENKKPSFRIWLWNQWLLSFEDRNKISESSTSFHTNVIHPKQPNFPKETTLNQAKTKNIHSHLFTGKKFQHMLKAQRNGSNDWECRVAIRTGKRNFSITPIDCQPFMSGVGGSTGCTGHTGRTGPRCSDLPKSCIAIQNKQNTMVI